MNEPPRVTRTCNVCGEEYLKPADGIPRFACSRVCWERHKLEDVGDCRPFFGPTGCGAHAKRKRYVRAR